MTNLRQLVAMGQTDEVLSDLMRRADTLPQSTQQGVVLLQASWQHLEQQTLAGTLSFEETDRMRNRINMGLLSVVSDIESGGKGKTVNLGALQADFLNADTGRIINQIKQATVNTSQVSDVQVGKAENVVIGSGNTVTTTVRKGWGKLQFGLVAVLLLVGLWFGWQAYEKLSGDSDDTLSSLSTIERQLAELSKKDASVATAMKANDGELQKTLEEAYTAYGEKDLEAAAYKMKKVADVAPAPDLLLNLALLYEKTGEEGNANTYFKKAFEASSGLKSTYINGLKGQRLNLIHLKNGGKLISSSTTEFENLLTEDYLWVDPGHEATFGFGNGLSGTFDEVGFKVIATESINVKEIELYSATQPRGPYKLIKKVTLDNIYLAETPFQMFKFAPVTAKYLKIKIISGYTAFNYRLNGLRVMGTLK